MGSSLSADDPDALRIVDVEVHGALDTGLGKRRRGGVRVRVAERGEFHEQAAVQADRRAIAAASFAQVHWSP